MEGPIRYFGEQYPSQRPTISFGGLSDGLEDLGKYTAVGVAGRSSPIFLKNYR
jgi:hypothetical protein